jgi:hypothetical protein
LAALAIFTGMSSDIGSQRFSVTRGEHIHDQSAGQAGHAKKILTKVLISLGDSGGIGRPRISQGWM